MATRPISYAATAKFKAYLEADLGTFSEWQMWEASTMASYVSAMMVQWAKGVESATPKTK